MITFYLLQNYVTSLNYNACNVIEINDAAKKLENELSSENINEMEEKYGCNIIILDEDGYSNALYNSMKNGDIMVDYLEGDRLLGKIIFPANSDSFHKLKHNLSLALWIVFIVILLLLYAVAAFIYLRILGPFKKLERFAGNISVGNLDLPLTMDRANYFGAFTESFDMMREELKRARQGEYDANRSKKELVAQLSHDIKTPVSTIKALCEILEIKLTQEEALSKIRTINQKADVIDKLISNMFHATLEELEVLKIEPCEEPSTIIISMLSDLNHYQKIQLKNSVPECLIHCDKLRLNQVIDNVINNSYKYADSDIDVTFYENKDNIEVEIRDYGTSVSKEELPLIFMKFYRGENASTHSGSGLGLYIAKQFMEGMGGGIECSIDQGFIVRLKIKKV